MTFTIEVDGMIEFVDELPPMVHNTRLGFKERVNRNKVYLEVSLGKYASRLAAANVTLKPYIAYVTIQSKMNQPDFIENSAKNLESPNNKFYK